jgi:hypothetical protein
MPRDTRASRLAAMPTHSAITMGSPAIAAAIVGFGIGWSIILWPRCHATVDAADRQQNGLTLAS